MAQLARDEAGNVWEVDAQGNAVRLVQPANTPIAPPNPAQQFEPQKAQADAVRAQAEAALAQAQTPYAADIARAEVQKALAEAEKARAEASRDPNAQVLDRGKIGQFLGLERQLERIEQLYKQGPGSTRGAYSVLDYLPSDVNAAFDSAGAGLSEVGLAAFRVPGAGSQSDTELRQFVLANTPSASDRDSAIREKLGNLRRRLESVKEAWGVDPKAPASDLLRQFSGEQPEPNIPGSALDVLRTTGGQGVAPLKAVPLADSTSEQFKTVQNPALARAHDDLVQTLLSQGGGRLDPQAYAQGRAALAREFGVDIPDPVADMAAGAQWATSINEYLDAGGRTVPTELNLREVMTAGEIARNNLINNPLGGAIIGAGNMLGLGAAEGFLPAQYAALSDAQGGSVLAGEIAGGIGGTMALGGVSRAGAARVAPQLLQGGARGQFMRNVATDVGYGAGVGAVSEGDPLTGAAFGGIGSVAGQGVARGLGAGVGGLQRTAAAQALRDRGVPVSVARQVGMGRFEDLAQSVPVVGDVSRARQLESFEGFNRAAMEEAGAPIGFAPTDIGRAGVDELQQAVGQAYNQAVQGVTAPLDRAFLKDMVPVRRMAQNMNQTNRAQLGEALRDAVQVPANAGAITPQQYQDAISNLKALRSNAKTAMPNSANTLRKAATQTINALEGAMMRAGGQNVVEGLQRANMANRGMNVIENAGLDRAAVGTQAGAPNVFTPAQLMQSVRASERRGYGDLARLRELGMAGQDVLPSTVPNSGTTDRMLAVQALGGAGALGGAAGFAGNPTAEGAAGGTATGLGSAASLAALAALLGTRGGQSALESILITRPQVAQRVGQGIRRRGGLFGSAGAAVGLNQQ
jgi:hypothetical protein